MPACFLGLDAGTSVIKAALFEGEGRPLGAAARPTRIDRPHPGWSETDPERTWSSAVAVIREALAAAGLTGGDVAAIGVSGAMVGLWAIDREGRASRPGIFWEDARAEPGVAAMRARDPEVLSTMFRSTGCVLQQGCTLPLLRWLLNHETEVMRRADAVFGCKDYLRFRLTSERATDPTEASVAPGDIRAGTRSDAMLALFELEDARRLLPPVLASDSVAGTVTRAAAAETGLAEGTPVAVGAGDVPSTVIGAGALDPGTACTILGTTCLNGIVTGQPVFTPPDIGLLFRLPGPAWMRTMVNVAGTLNLDWCAEALCPDLAGRPDLFDTFEAMASAVAVGAEGITYLPYLSDSGIVAPRVAYAARGQFSGLAPGHRRAALIRAVYEGVALSIRDCFAAIERPLDSVVLCGGGARSRFWSAMIADVLQVPVRVPEGTELGAKGAALLAATAVGAFPSVRAASAAARRIARIHEPTPAAAPAWDAAFRRYRRHRDALLAALDDTGSA